MIETYVVRRDVRTMVYALTLCLVDRYARRCAIISAREHHHTLITGKKHTGLQSEKSANIGESLEAK